MHKDIAVKLQNISKVYKLYDKPIDRLKESLHPFKKKYHKDFYALKNINLEIKKGEVLGIVGVNGAGKSTLLKIIAGVLTPTSGRVIINGRINAILELSSGLKPEMTGRQNIKLNLQINGIEENTKQITQAIIDFADIGEHIDQPVKTYSSGMKARLGFGLATSTDPDVLIVDEVLAVGDVLFRRKCYSRIEKLFKDGKTVIFVSHDAQSVVEFCSHAILLYDREIILSDTPKKVTEHYEQLVFSKDKDITAKQIASKIDDKNNAQTNDIGNNEFIADMDIQSDNTNNGFFEFSKIHIKNHHGEVVNNLVRGTYTLEFYAKAKRDVSNVSFGAQFMSIKGIIISGINSKNLLEKTIPIVHMSEKLKVQIEFENIFLTSTYIIRVFAKDNNEEIAMQNNSYIFKVKKLDYNQAGYVTLNQKIKIFDKNDKDIFESE